MARAWNKWKSRWNSRDTHWASSRDYRSYSRSEEEGNYNFLKKSLIAALIFAVIYGLHLTDTQLSRSVDDTVRYVLTAQTDFSAVSEELAKYAPQGFDQTVLKRVQSTITKPADPLQYMTKPVEGKLSLPFGWQTHPVLKQEMMNDGISIKAPLGSSVRAASQGTVKTVTESAKYGRIVIVDHGLDTETTYGHLGEVLVKAGESVSQGQVIARVGKSGITSVPALYFEVREKGKPVDPMTRIKGEWPLKEGK